MEKIDLRIQKTKKNIYESFLQLLQKDAFENIKVSEICEKALINRSTFYAHFEDKYCLLDSFIKDLKIELRLTLEKNENITSSKEYYMKLIELLLEHIESSKEIYGAVMLNNRNSVAMDMIYDTLKEDIKKRIENEKMEGQKIPASFVSDFYLGAIFNIGMEWIRTNKTYTKEEILKYLDTLIPASTF